MLAEPFVLRVSELHRYTDTVAINGIMFLYKSRRRWSLSSTKASSPVIKINGNVGKERNADFVYNWNCLSITNCLTLFLVRWRTFILGQ